MSPDKILEIIAAVSGIVSVWFSRKGNILVYPVGLINTAFYTYLSFKYQLIGESSVNFYYTIMSIYGWILWSEKDKTRRPVLHISYSDNKLLKTQVVFFLLMYVIIFTVLTFLKKYFYPGAIPWADGFAAATAFTGMWMMARKKVESWYWWIATNITSVPLYYVKDMEVTSVYYLVLLGLAFWGLNEWKHKADAIKK